MTHAFDFSDFTFCIPIRIDSPQRLRNLECVINYYTRYTNANFIVVESDTERRLLNKEFLSNIQYEFIKDDNIIFHRTQILNRMLSTVGTKFAGIWDSDAIAPVEQICEALEYLRNNNSLAMAYPFDGKFWNISNYFVNLFYDSLNIKLLSNYPQQKQLLYGYHSVGGAFIVNIEVYRKYGWENENFKGWGPEDSERFRRLEILGNTPVKINGDLYHLDHPRGVNSGNANEALSLSTRKEYAKVCSMEPEELKKYIETWSWIKKND